MAADELAMKATLDAGGFNSGIDGMIAKTQGLDKAAGAAGISTGRLGSVLGLAGSGFGLAAIGATAAGAALYGSAKAAANWETSMAGVAKTSGFGGQELQTLSQQLLDMSTSMPIAASSLAEVAKVAGALGVPKEEIAGFTNTAAQMGVAFDMNASDAATMGAQILTSFKMPMRNMEDLGNVVNTMGDSFAATEPQVLDFLNRASFLGATMDQTIPQVAALGTTMISTGLNAELSATGIKSLLNTALDPKNIGAFADLLGVETSEVGKTLKEDLGGSLIKVADSLAEIQDPAERFNAAMGVAGSHGAMALMKLSGQMDNFRKAQELSNKQWQAGDSMSRTFATNAATTNAAWQELSNTMNKAGVELGNVMLPGIADSIDKLNELAKAGISAGEQIYGAFQKFETKRQGLEAWLGERGLSPYMAGLTEGAEGAIEGTTLRNLDMTKMISDTYADLGAEMAMPKSAQETWMDSLVAWSKTTSREMAPLLASGIYDGFALAMINAQSDAARDAADNRAFEYAGKRMALKITSSGQGALQQLWADNIKLWESKGLEYGATYLTPQQVWKASGVGVAFPETGTAAYYRIMGDEAKAQILEIQEAMKPPEISMWDISDSQRSWQKFSYENQSLAKTAGDEIMLAFYNARTSGIMEGTTKEAQTLKESMGFIESALTAPGAIPEGMVEAALQDLVSADIISLEMAADIRIKASSVEVEDFTGMIGESVSMEFMKAREYLRSEQVFSDLLFGTESQKAEAVNAIDQNIGDVSRLWESHLKASADYWMGPAEEMGALIPPSFWNSVLTSWDTHSEMWAGDLRDRMSYLSEQVTDVYGGWEGFLVEGTFDEQLGAAKFLMGEFGTQARQSSEDMNMFKESVGGCGTALSAFGSWQESTPELFMQPYIGQFEGYMDTWETNMTRMQWQAYQTRQTGGALLGSLTEMEGIAPPWMGGDTSVNLKVNVDASSLQTALDSYQSIDSKEITLSADTSQAVSAIDSLRSMAEAPIVIPVYVEVDVSAYADVQGAVDEAIRSALGGYGF